MTRPPVSRRARAPENVDGARLRTLHPLLLGETDRGPHLQILEGAVHDRVLVEIYLAPHGRLDESVSLTREQPADAAPGVLLAPLRVTADLARVVLELTLHRGERFGLLCGLLAAEYGVWIVAAGLVAVAALLVVGDVATFLRGRRSERRWPRA